MKLESYLVTTESLEPNRRRGRSRTSGAEVKLPEQKPFKQPRMRYEPTKVLSDDELESIHLASLRILSDYGMDFLDPDARDLLKKAGAKVEDQRVRFDPEMVLETIKTCPSEFKLHARNPAHTLNIGGNWMAFGSVASTPNFIGLDGVRHPGTRADFQDLLKLTQVFNIIHFNSGYPVEPIDLHASIRHIETTYDLLTMTDKAIHCYSLGRQRNRDVLEMCRIARQVDDAT
ncbi:MAG: methyltransferase, partial [Actinobacteria bacterium]|nr:methyltransferase [Actinomycetota bacterium]